MPEMADEEIQHSPADELINKPAQPIDLSTASKSKPIIAALTVSLGTFAVGNCFGWSSPVQIQLQMNSSFNADENYENTTWSVALTPNEMSWAGSLINIGALAGTTLAGIPMDSIGRRYTLMSSCVPFAIGWLLISLAINSSMFYVGRVICGLACGICFAVVPTYNSEISTPNIRGMAGFFFTLNIAFGALFTSILGLVGLHWRVISLIGLVPVIGLLVGMIFIPESPVFLIRKERKVEALNALEWLRGLTYRCDREMELTEDFIRKNSEGPANIRDLRMPGVHKPVLMGVFLMVLQQFAGFNATAFYGAEIFQLAGSDIDPLLCTVIINGVALVSCGLAAVIVDKIPRRVLFGASEIIACFSWMALGAYFHLVNGNATLLTGLGWVPLVSVIIITVVVGCGLSPIPWVVSSEVLPIRFRGPAIGLIAFTNRLMSFLITKTFVDLQGALTTAGTFWFYGSCCFVGALFALLIMPETKGKSSEEIQKFFLES